MRLIHSSFISRGVTLLFFFGVKYETGLILCTCNSKLYEVLNIFVLDNNTFYLFLNMKQALFYVKYISKVVAVVTSGKL